MIKRYLITLMICFSLLLSGCVSPQADNTVDLDGTAWVLTSLNGANLFDGHRPTLEFNSGQISGNSGCNHYGGTYQIKGDRIRMEELFWTEMACLEPAGVMDQEQDYLDLLQNANQLKVREDTLILLNDGGEELTYISKAVATQTAPQKTPDVTQTPSPMVVTLEITPTEDPPIGFYEYRDEVAGVGVFIPEGWIVTGILEGKYAILQSYPEDKYVGGEKREEGDTKCDLNIHPQDGKINDIVDQWESDARVTIVSEGEIVLDSGSTARRLVIDNLGRAVVFIAEINQRIVQLTCFGDFSQVDEIAASQRALK